MSKLTREDVLKLAHLARLKLTEEEVEHLQVEMNSILQYVAQLQEVDLSEFEPSYQVTGLKNVMRPDEVIDYGVPRESLLKNVPSKEDGHIKVKRMIG